MHFRTKKKQVKIQLINPGSPTDLVFNCLLKAFFSNVQQWSLQTIVTAQLAKRSIPLNRPENVTLMSSHDKIYHSLHDG
jgi:hypothetical protein